MNERWKDTYDQWKTDYPSITDEEERKLERATECQYCDGSGFFYSDPDLGPCNCVLDANEYEPVPEGWTTPYEALL